MHKLATRHRLSYTLIGFPSITDQLDMVTCNSRTGTKLADPHAVQMQRMLPVLTGRACRGRAPRAGEGRCRGRAHL